MVQPDEEQPERAARMVITSIMGNPVGPAIRVPTRGANRAYHEARAEHEREIE